MYNFSPGIFLSIKSLQFELDFVDLNLGYSFPYSIAYTKNSAPFDGGNKSWICNLIRAHICLPVWF